MRWIEKHIGARRAVAWRWALCVAYALFTVAPHFEVLSHSHAGGGAAHHHNFLSAHDVAIERALLEASGLPGAAPRSEIAPEFRAESRAVHRAPLPRGMRGLDVAGAARHSHGQEDPNLAALGTPARDLCLVFAPLASRENPVLATAERAVLAASARAPPRA